MNTKFYELSTRIGTVNRNAEAGESLSEENWNKISNLPSESTAHEDNLAEQPIIHINLKKILKTRLIVIVEAQ